MPPTPPRARSRRLIAVATPLLLFVSLVCWAFASPVGASPDDDFHLASIWCGQGDRPDLCEQSGEPDSRLVPSALEGTTCYAFLADQSADCWNPDRHGLSEATWLNTGGLYPPGFYAVMSVFAGPDVQVSVIAVRILNAALAIGLLTATFWALPRRIRPALVISALATSVPLSIFIVPSTNPSSWALVAACIVWVSMYGAMQTTGRRQIVLSALSVGGALLGASARADAAIFAVYGVAIAWVLGGRLRKGMVLPMAATAAIVVAAAIFYLTSGQSQAVVAGLPTTRDALTLDQLAKNAIDVPTLWMGALGGWGLGWLDTIMPTLVTFLSLAVACGAVFIGVRRLTPRRATALSLGVLALWLVPFVLLAQSKAIVGEIVQPRYILPLLIIAVGIASVAPGTAWWWRGPRAYIAAASLAIAAALALHTNIRRYTTGLDDLAVDPGANAEWWWSMPIPPIAVWIVGSAAFAGAMALIAFLPQRGPEVPDEEGGEADPTRPAGANTANNTR